MTTAQAVGAVSREAAEWYAIDWPAINRNVRRLQVRIVQATKASRWGRVRALQRLLTHSYSGKVLTVRRVTENNGKKTPGVDQEIWDTPEKKTQAVHALKRRGYLIASVAIAATSRFIVRSATGVHHRDSGWRSRTYSSSSLRLLRLTCQGVLHGHQSECLGSAT